MKDRLEFIGVVHRPCGQIRDSNYCKGYRLRHTVSTSDTSCAKQNKNNLCTKVLEHIKIGTCDENLYI